ncbi:26263_t:CDS:2 [Dentiscutata erythropus]|uniref:26263_t:CDS:1 n=1 Tax=Dentiscutata erythropus TaxID=1348616 RepID=A0A9N8VAM5_9GLOM|nr:26263_t:CDS:2 [Dentiscutata erythropus]
MKCEKCQLFKLTREFPDGTISSTCKHITSWCLECLVGYLKEVQHQCPTCKTELSEQEVVKFNLFWEKANFKIDLESFLQTHAEHSGPTDENFNNLYVVLLNGEIITLSISNIKTIKVKDLKGALKDKIRVDITQQMLIYNGIELNNYRDDGTDNTLENYGINPNSYIQLVVVLYSIPKDQALTNLIFDLHWKFPSSGHDFLDGTCMIFEGDKLWKTYDYLHSKYPRIRYIEHSGDLMDTDNAGAHHEIKANLNELPKSVGQLYFILSSWRSPNIGLFKKPEFKLYDPAKPNVNLCDYTVQRAADSQAVILCLINRSRNDMWKVIPVEETTNGNAKDYSPIEEKIKSFGLFNTIL